MNSRACPPPRQAFAPVAALRLDAFEGHAAVVPGIGKTHAPSDRRWRRWLMQRHSMAIEMEFARDGVGLLVVDRARAPMSDPSATAISVLIARDR